MLLQTVPVTAIYILLLITDVTPLIGASEVVDNLNGSSNNTFVKNGCSANLSFAVPQIYQMFIKSNVSNRFAHTTVTTRLKNIADKAQEAIFSVVLPKDAFISGFIMEADGINYTAYIKGQTKTKTTVDYTVSNGLPEAHVAATVRDSNRFTVSTKIKPQSKVAFHLTYEELLKRRNGHYELVVNLYPGQLINDLNVKIHIAENRKLINVKTPPLRSGNKIEDLNNGLDPKADISILNETSAIIKFSPNFESQKQVAQLLGSKEKEGIAAQFIVQYDVERNSKGGDIFIQNGYFAHFFAPSELNYIPKYIVFVVGTNCGVDCISKIKQVKTGMLKILDQLNENDLFHLIEYREFVKVWDINNPNSSKIYKYNKSFNYWQDRLKPHVRKVIMNYSFPKAIMATADNIKKAKSIVNQFEDEGGPEDIHSALTIALRLTELTKEANNDNADYQPIIVFLSDGFPEAGRIINPKDIMADITKMNADGSNAPIIIISFARNDLRKQFLDKVAFHNFGFSKHLYEASDGALQLENYYKEISSLLLTNITFQYTSPATNLTETQFPILFYGSELAVAGYYDDIDATKTGYPSCVVNAWDGYKSLFLQPDIYKPTVNVERLWAYLTLRQLLDKIRVLDEGTQELKTKASDIALKYSYVTPINPLIVITPSSLVEVNTEPADKVIESSDVFDLGQIQDVDDIGKVKDIDQSNSSVPTNQSESCVESYTPTLHTQRDILTAIPWLKNHVNKNGELVLSTVAFKLGLNETISDKVNCNTTPSNTPGYCMLLADCPSMHHFLINLDIFQVYFCILQTEYAGICCPSPQTLNKVFVANQ